MPRDTSGRRVVHLGRGARAERRIRATRAEQRHDAEGRCIEQRIKDAGGQLIKVRLSEGTDRHQFGLQQTWRAKRHGAVPRKNRYSGGQCDADCGSSKRKRRVHRPGPCRERPGRAGPPTEGAYSHGRGPDRMGTMRRRTGTDWSRRPESEAPRRGTAMAAYRMGRWADAAGTPAKWDTPLSRCGSLLSRH
jgi:hypothetical protein